MIKNIAIKGEKTQKEKITAILREMGGFFLLPLGIPSNAEWYYVDNEGFVRIHWNKNYLEKCGYECITVDEYDKRRCNHDEGRDYCE